MTKLIAIEEHFLTPETRAAWAASKIGQEGAEIFHQGEIEARLDDLGEARIALMDEAGVDVQVLSVTTPALHNLEPGESVILARQTNDVVASAVARHPDRFEGFATLPTAAPEAAAEELERCVLQLGLKGWMSCGRTREKNLDHPDFRPILQTAARLGVPVFIHPQLPQREVREAYYSGFGEPIDTAFAAFGLGWHYEAGMQFLRLVLAGVFEELPELQIILGHWGEVVLFFVERMGGLARVAGLPRPVVETMQRNLYVTSSGMWSEEYLRRTLDIVGVERILFSTDYPYQYRPGNEARGFFERVKLSAEEKEMFGHGNWERLTGRVENYAKKATSPPATESSWSQNRGKEI